MSRPQDRHFRCFTCGQDYRVTGWPGPLRTLQQEVVMRCIRQTGNTAGREWGTASVPANVTCGAVLGWTTRAYPHATRSVEHPVTTAHWRHLTEHVIAPKSIVEARDGALAETARLGAELDQLRAALDDAHRAIAHLDPDGLATELGRLRALHETPCPGLVHPWREGQDGVQACGGYAGHPGGCAPYWAPQSGWRVPA